MALNLGQREDVRKFLLDVARLIVAMAILAPLAKSEVVSARALLGAASVTLLCVAWALKMNSDGG